MPLCFARKKQLVPLIRHHRLATAATISILAAVSFVAASSCKTPSRGSANSDGGLFDVSDDYIKLRDFGYETDGTILNSLAARIGCKQASEFILQPASGSIKRTVDGIYSSKAPYDYMQQELFNTKRTEQTCRAAGEPAQRSNTDGMRALLQKAQAKNLGITIIMVGGFGSHLTEDGALSDSRTLWQQTFASEINSKQLRVVRHECMPNSYATDDVCSPKLIEKFKQLETERGAVEHRYLLWGYSKGGTTILQALGTSAELRDKTLALVTIGSPFGGGLPIEIAYPIVESLAKKRATMAPADRALLNTLIAFGAGSGLQMQDTTMNNRMIALLEEQEFEVLRGGFKSLLPGTRKTFLNTTVKNWDFTRTAADPLTGKKDLPILHVAAALDVARLRAIPVMTTDASGRIIPMENSQDMSQLSELAMLGVFKRHPVNDSCVAIEHAVIPKNATPRGATTSLLGILNLDHMSIGFSKPAKELAPAPRTEIVDAIIEGTMQKIGVN